MWFLSLVNNIGITIAMVYGFFLVYHVGKKDWKIVMKGSEFEIDIETDIEIAKSFFHFLCISACRLIQLNSECTYDPFGLCAVYVLRR